MPDRPPPLVHHDLSFCSSSTFFWTTARALSKCESDSTVYQASTSLRRDHDCGSECDFSVTTSDNPVNADLRAFLSGSADGPAVLVRVRGIAARRLRTTRNCCPSGHRAPLVRQHLQRRRPVVTRAVAQRIVLGAYQRRGAAFSTCCHLQTKWSPLPSSRTPGQLGARTTEPAPTASAVTTPLYSGTLCQTCPAPSQGDCERYSWLQRRGDEQRVTISRSSSTHTLTTVLGASARLQPSWEPVTCLVQ